MATPIETGGAPGKLACSRWLLRLLSMAAISLIGALGLDQVNAQDAPPMSSKAAELDPFEQRVREYLLRNPEVIMEALRILQERQRAAEAEGLKRTIAERSDEILNDPAAPVGGNPAGDVTLVEFFDYNCPYCRRVAPTVAELEEADPDLRLVYKEFPILGPGSQFAARAALASRKQGKYVRVPQRADAGERAGDGSRPSWRSRARSASIPSVSSRTCRTLRSRRPSHATCSSRTPSGSPERRASSSAIAWCRGPSTSGRCRA